MSFVAALFNTQVVNISIQQEDFTSANHF